MLLKLRSLASHSATLIPQAALGTLGWLRGAIGAIIAVGISALITLMLLGANAADMPWLIAPLGASAVLVFAVPASPLAQPWPVIGGNLISAVIGLGLGQITGSPLIAASLAVGIAIAVMSVTRSLHPPGGACALFCALGAAGPDAWGWLYLLPVAANVVALSCAGWFYNNLTGHKWPHHIQVPHSKSPIGDRVHHTRRDIEIVLAEWDEMLDVDVDDLHAFYQALERHVAKRRAKRGR